jgi:transposase-like protein
MPKYLRKEYTPQQKLEWGKEAYETHLSRGGIAAKFSVAESQVDTYKRAYEIQQGFHTPDNPPNTSDSKAMIILERLKTGPYRRNKKQPTIKGGMSIEERRARDAARKRAASAAKREAQQDTPATNGSGQHLVPVQTKQDRSEFYQVRIKELEYELDRAHDEVMTLQKILMTVGRTL